MSFLPPEDFYNVEEMTPAECLKLARSYQNASIALKKVWLKRDPASRAPFRFTAVHSIELFLTTYLLVKGEPWSSVRSMGHSLDRRHERAADLGLKMNSQTKLGLDAISGSREYLRSRYSARETSVVQLNKLEAILKQVSETVSHVLEKV